MRTVREVATLDPVDVGDHVCWLVDPADDFAGTARAFTADADLFGDKVLLLEPGRLRLGPSTADGGVLALLRQESDRAAREGFRALRVLTEMDDLWPGGADPEEVVRHELHLDALAAAGGAILVCAYRHDRFGADALLQAAGVHPQWLGKQPPGAEFRLYCPGPQASWTLSGVVDADGAASLGTALCELLRHTPRLDVACERLELLDASAMTALVRAARSRPDARLVLRGVNEAIRRHWRLVGYDDPQIPVELAR